MPSLPFFEDQQAPATRVPSVAITLGDSSGGDSDFGGIAAAAGSLLGGPSQPSWADHLVSLTLQQGFAPAVDHLDLLVAVPEASPGGSAGSSGPQAALGDAGSVEIGASDALVKLFTGQVISIEKRSDGLHNYRLGNGSHALSRVRLNGSVGEMSVSEAVSHLAGEAGYSVDSNISGNDGALPQIVYDDSRSAWEHCAEWACLRGFNLWLDADDRLQLSDGLEQGEVVAEFTRGENLLHHRLWQRAAHSGEINAFGGSRVDGDFTLRKQSTPNRAQSGSGAPQRFYRDGSLQAQQDLSTRAQVATLFAARRTSEGEILVSGNAAIGPGKVIKLSRLPNNGEGNYLVSSCRHTFDRQHGWRTQLQISDCAAVGAGALGGLL